jgi:hypothetical protein
MVVRIGVPLIGDDGSNTPPQHALSAQGIITGLKGFPIYGNYQEANPPASSITAVTAGDVDLASVWGPVGGYFAHRSPIPLDVALITGQEAFAPLSFEFDITVGVRKEDDDLRRKIDGVLKRRRSEICALLASYSVPRAGPICETK